MADISGQPPRSNNPPPFLVRLFATGLFTGYSPLAPGTAGSLLGIAVYLLTPVGRPVVLAAATAVTFLLGTAASASMEKAYGSDPSIVVIDEVVGMWISLLALPATPAVIVSAFVLFRIFDTFKPPPARNFEAMKHGFGVMMDDVAAGIYANLAVRLLLAIFPGLG